MVELACLAQVVEYSLAVKEIWAQSWADVFQFPQLLKVVVAASGFGLSHEDESWECLARWHGNVTDFLVYHISDV